MIRNYTTVDENGTTHYTVEELRKNVVQVSRPFSNDSFYEIFTYDASGMETTLTIDYHHGGGSGTINVPMSIFYEMPTFAAILQHFQGGRTFGKTEIFASEPVTTLFEDAKY